VSGLIQTKKKYGNVYSTCGAKIDNEEAIPADKKEENQKED